MTFKIISEHDFIRTLNSIDNFILSYGLNTDFSINFVAFEFNEKIIATFPYETKQINEVLSNKNFYLYDLKTFYKCFGKPVNNVIDIKLAMYSIFNEPFTLDGIKCKDLTGRTYQNKFEKHYSESKVIPFEVISKNNINNSIQSEIKIFKSLRNFIRNHYKSSEFDQFLHRIAYMYADIETTPISYNYFRDVEYIKHFDSLINAPYLNVHYDFDHTVTGRLMSNFHTFPKDLRRKVLKSRYTDGVIMYIDQKNFEFKIALDIAGVSCDYEDIYLYLLKKTNNEELDRDFIKKESIRYIYGGSNIQEDVLNAIEECFGDIKSKIFKKMNVDGFSLTTPLGKEIEYETFNEMKRKAINNIIQNQASYMVNEGTYKIFEVLKEHNLKSKIIATLYDEVIIDCARPEIDFMKKLAEKFLKFKNNNIKYEILIEIIE